MKVMAGYDNRRKTDYRAKAAEEVSKVQQKARILEEMLENYRAEDRESGQGAEVSLLGTEMLDGSDDDPGARKCNGQCSTKDPKNVRRRVRRS